MKSQEFIYEQAFDRNIGWLTTEEQAKLRRSCVAIAGLGGAGGFQAQVLARLGVGRFKIADLDTFELTNINRQIGASIETLGRAKTPIIRDMIFAINPEAQVESFNEGINPKSIDSFLESADLALDGIDFFAQNTKLLLFRKCYEKGIPAITSCPLGFGASLLAFSPKGMKYEDYFDLRDGMSEKEMRMTCTPGLAPSALCLPYMDKQALDLKGQRTSSVVPGLMLVAALSGTEAVKILTGKRSVRYAPHVYEIDLLTQRVRKKYYPMGMKSPLQRIKRWLYLKLMNTQLYYLLRPRKAADLQIAEQLSKT
ncbi:MAG: ThiF family adenylyltransferase [Candidatus Omnitrophica bacterium]|nr:ThiF family adenylyltransferase [Candidatus Omnitrophota bacterium]